MPIFDLTLCGPPGLTRDGAPVREADLPAKSLALLAFLALERGAHARDELATLLWGESPQDKARASLRQSLRSLRGLVGDQIRVSRDTVSLDPGLRCDVLRFLDLASTDPAAAARVEVPRFLDGFAPRHARPFEEWAEETRGRLMARYRGVLAECGDTARSRRDWRQCITIGERWLGADPLSSDAARLLVEARYCAGDHAGALEAYAAFRARHEEVLGVPPDAALRELAGRIRAERPPPGTAAGSDPWAAGSAVFETALRGREAEWATLMGAWGEATGGTGRVVVIEGEAGAGKSRLADDFCRWVTSNGGRVLRARAWESGRTTRYDTLLALLREVIGQPGIAGADPISLGVVARVMPETRRRFPAITPHDTDPGTAVLEEAVADLLLAVAEDHPLLVVVDDFHWCDADTGVVLHYLARRLALAPVLWCLGLTLGHAEEEAPSVRIARALRALPGARRLPLAPLSADDVWGVIRDLGRVGSEAAGRRLAARVHEVTGGNPFFVTELLKEWWEQGGVTAHPDSGEWLLPGEQELMRGLDSVPATVQEAVAQRVGRLPEDLQLVLVTIAAHEQGLPPDVLSHVHGMSRLRVTALGDELVTRLLATESAGTYQCAHPIIAQVMQESLGASRRRELHRAIALAMHSAAREGGPPAHTGDIARHADAGGERALAYEQAMLAAESSKGHGATAEALHWLDVASRNAGGAAQATVVDRATAELLEVAAAVAPRAPGTRTGEHRIPAADPDLGGVAVP